MIKHLTPRSSMEIFLKKFPKKLILFIMTLPVFVICLPLSIILFCIITPVASVVLLFLWAKENLNYMDNEEIFYIFWRYPGAPIIWYLEKVYDFELENVNDDFSDLFDYF